MTSFPSALDSLTNPGGADPMDAPSHSDQHSNANDAIEALQVKVGVDSSAVTSSLDYKVSHATMNTDTDLSSNSYFLDEDSLTSDSDTKVASQQSIKKYIDDQIAAIDLSSVHPVNSIYLNISGTNPATELGFGTWSAVATGQMLVGYDSGDSDFNAAEKTGGSKTHTLTTSEIPSHYHSVNPPSTTTSSDNHRHGFGPVGTSGSWGLLDSAHASSSGTGYTQYDAHTHTLNIGAFNSASTGSGNSHSILNKYYTVYVWKRTA